MKRDIEWVLTTVDGKIAGAATDFRVAADVMARVARLPVRDVGEVVSRKISMEELEELSWRVRWEDLMLFGTAFQKRVWRTLFDLGRGGAGSAGHSGVAMAGASGSAGASGAAAGLETGSSAESVAVDTPASSRLYSYSDFAELCGNPAGVRAVAHAVGCNPISVIIPCHLIVPKEAIDRLREIEAQAAATLFGRDGLRITSGINFGEYRCGRALKRRLILDLLGM